MNVKTLWSCHLGLLQHKLDKVQEVNVTVLLGNDLRLSSFYTVSKAGGYKTRFYKKKNSQKQIIPSQSRNQMKNFLNKLTIMTTFDLILISRGQSIILI